MEESESPRTPSTGLVLRKFYLAAFFAGVGNCALGAAMGYSSPAFLSIAEPNSRFTHLTPDQQSWVGSIMTIGALFGGLIAGPFIDRFGRKTLLIVVSFPFTVGWLTIAYSGSFVPMLIGRVFTGLCCGAISLVIPVYVSECSPAEVRGFMGSCMQLSSFFGVLLAYIIGMGVNWSWLALILAVLPVLCSVSMIFMPESPRWLICQGKKGEALRGIDFLMGPDVDAEKECKEMEDNLRQQPSGKVAFKEYLGPAILRPLLLSLALMVFQQWSGFNGVLFYSGTIFKTSGFDSIKPEVSSIILGSLQLFGTLVSSFIVDRAGRKALLQFSGIVMALGLTALTVLFVLVEARGQEIIDNYGWVTVVGLGVYVFAFAFGYGPVAWLMMGELLPVRVRGPASAFSTAFNWTNAFLVTKIFSVLNDASPYAGYLIYDVVCVLACVFVHFLLPETKGKTLEDIERFFAPSKVKQDVAEKGGEE